MKTNYNEIIFSIIVPVYNVELYLKQCIESILRQSYTNIEVILVDDGSTDNSGVICDDYRERDSRIIVIHKENGGLSDARNHGIRIANGNYIIFVDSDDIISDFFVEMISDSIMKTKADMIAIDNFVPFWDLEEPHGLLTHYDNKVNIKEVSSEEAIKLMFLYKIPTGAPFKICKREVFESVSFPKGRIYEDLATTYKEFINSKRIIIIDSKLYAYRKRNNSIIRQDFTLRKMDIIEISYQLINDIDNMIPELSALARCRVFSTLFSVFLQIPKDKNEYMQLVWKEICNYRCIVLRCGEKIRIKDRIAALISFLGMNISYSIGNKVGRIGTIK